jgi:signal transduction histidine kinase
VAITVRAGVAAHLAGDDDPDGALADIMSVSAQALDELRGTLGLLRDPGAPAPTVPAVPGLTAATLAGLLERPRAAGLRVEGDIELDAGVVPLAVQQAAYRIVQEALTNTMRHSTASAVRVSVGARDGRLTIEIADDGAATAPAVPGHGLQGMEERAGTLGGKVSAGPDDHGGWTVRATLPLAPV